MLAQLEATVKDGGSGSGDGCGGNTAAVAAASSDAKDPKSSWKKLASLLMQLRKVVNHPFLFDGADPNPGITDESLIEASGKLQVKSDCRHQPYFV
jgi:hypothetical protein